MLEVPLAPLAPLLVFAQRTDARIDVDAWNDHGARFFATRIGLATNTPSGLGEAPPRESSAQFVVAPEGIAAGIRRTSARPRSSEDLARAHSVEARNGGAGLALLAARCSTVWLVECEGERDVLAWSLAVVLASALLGPILDGTARLVGAKTGRAIRDSLR